MYIMYIMYIMYRMYILYIMHHAACRIWYMSMDAVSMFQTQV